MYTPIHHRQPTFKRSFCAKVFPVGDNTHWSLMRAAGPTYGGIRLRDREGPACSPDVILGEHFFATHLRIDALTDKNWTAADQLVLKLGPCGPNEWCVGGDLPTFKSLGVTASRQKASQRRLVPSQAILQAVTGITKRFSRIGIDGKFVEARSDQILELFGQRAVPSFHASNAMIKHAARRSVTIAV